MNLLDDRERRYIPEIVTSFYYAEQIANLKPVLSMSRCTLFFDPDSLQTTFECLAETLMRTEGVIRTGKTLCDNESNIDDLSAFRQRIDVHKAVSRVAQSIADGIAWRLFGYDRSFLRYMIEPDKYRGSVDLTTSFPVMKEAAMELQKRNNSIVFYNDLSNFLRIGDLTEFLSDGTVLIHELKKNGRRLQNITTELNKLKYPKHKISQQMEHVLRAQVSHDLRVQIVNDSEIVPIRELPLQFHNYLTEVNRLIRKTRKEYIASQAMGDFLVVQCVDLRRLALDGVSSWNELMFNEDMPDDDAYMCVSNFDLWKSSEGKYARNTTPYAVFPFGLDDVLGLISGTLWLQSWINFSALQRYFTNNGWYAEPIDVEALSSRMNSAFVRPDGRRAAASEMATAASAFTVTRGGFSLTIPMALLLRVAFDFMNPSVLIAIAEQLRYSTSLNTTDEQLLDVNIAGEKLVWH